MKFVRFLLIGAAVLVGLLAMCYVMQGKDDSARSALAGIKGKFVKPAKELLGKMGGE